MYPKKIETGFIYTTFKRNNKTFDLFFIDKQTPIVFDIPDVVMKNEMMPFKL